MDLTEFEILRRECGWSIAELASALDVEERTVLRWMRGEKSPGERSISSYVTRLAEAAVTAGISPERWRAALYGLKDRRRQRTEGAPNPLRGWSPTSEHSKPSQAISSAVKPMNPSRVAATPWSPSTGFGPPFGSRRLSRTTELRVARTWLAALQEAQSDLVVLTRKEIRHRAGQPRVGENRAPGSVYFYMREEAVVSLLAAGLSDGAERLEYLTQPIMGVISDPGAALAAISEERILLGTLDTQVSSLFFEENMSQGEVRHGDR